MSSSLTSTVIKFIQSSEFGKLSSAIGLIALTLLLLLLIGSILLDASGERKLTKMMRSFDLALVPLLLILGVVGALRLAQILHIL